MLQSQDSFAGPAMWTAIPLEDPLPARWAAPPFRLLPGSLAEFGQLTPVSWDTVCCASDIQHQKRCAVQLPPATDMRDACAATYTAHMRLRMLMLDRDICDSSRDGRDLLIATRIDHPSNRAIGRGEILDLASISL